MEYITEKNRIYSKDSDGSIIAEVTFPEVECGIYNINHTCVNTSFTASYCSDTSLRGKGVAGKLVELAIKQIKAQGGKITASCSYAQSWIAKYMNQKEEI